jgi:DNA-nicking Smr family endonuclease
MGRGERAGRGVPRIEAEDRLFEEAMALLGEAGQGHRDGTPKRPATPRPPVPASTRGVPGPGAREGAPARTRAHRDDPAPRPGALSAADEALFLDAMGDLRGPNGAPTTEAPRVAARPELVKVPTVAPPDPGIEVVADLDQFALEAALGDTPPPPLVEAAPLRTVTATPQVMDAKRFRQLLDKRRMRVEADLDLHGSRSLDAVGAVRDFLDTSAAAGLKVVRIIHGKGHHSEGGPVLRDLVRRLLRTDLEDRWTALTSPPEHMGGDGATVLLLRTKRDDA